MGVEQLLDRVWTIKGKTYDLTKFAANHPGGERAIENAAAHPNGELFVESYHPDPELIYNTISKYEVKGNVKLINPVNDTFKSEVKYTFDDKGWYRRVKKAGMAAVRGTNKKFAKKTNLRGDLTYLLFDCLHLLLLLVATMMLWFGSWKAAVCCGILRAACIMRIAHVASHASLSPWADVNKLLYYISMMFSGTTPEIWSRKHVVRHHINTNEDGLDEDRMDPLKCVAPGLPYHEFHKNQHIYMWPFYMHVVGVWALSDFLGNGYRANAGCMPFKTKDVMLNYFTLGVHFLITYFLPIYCQGWLWGLFLIEINTVLTSTIFGFEFIVNHEIDGCDIFQDYKDKEIDWGKYQAISSADFHPLGWGAWFFNQLTGGLNLQICHHLFPGVHYRHYPVLTEVIYKLAKEDGFEPTYSSSVIEAVSRHHQFLKNCSNEFKKTSLKTE
eukprot:TRINITY_DN1537_c3_g1_i1.p1 TRINITY_DN1537_c3_g1~~TRINITY_DN1537_c3_g1_i1.p1  ORF type:complete len:465 (+),score=74.44 TRINITY_DN1537_c3_g1_i1:72-1397(+)